MTALEIVPYDSDWIDAFETERGRVSAALGEIALRIDHNGSTSVAGMAAKPIIDIQISVFRLHPMDAYATALQQLGYVHRPDADDDFCPFFHRPQQWPHSHHVHVVQSGGAEERRTLAFRDYLRDHAEVAREYEMLKRRLAGEYGGDSALTREAYADAKGAFIERVVAIASRNGYPHGLTSAVRRESV